MARPSPRTIGIIAAACALAWLLAFGIDTAIGRLLALPDDATLATTSDMSLGAETTATASARPERPTTPRRVSKSDLVNPIVKRSIFDSSKIGQEASKGDPTGPVGLSDLDATLLATIVADPPEYSSALISSGKGGAATRGYGIGYDLMGEGTIVEIHARKVVIERPDGSREFIQMNAEAQVRRASSGALPGKEGEGEGDGPVQKVGENKYVVDASFIEKALENPEKLASQVRVAPHKGSDGQVDGYRMSGIRRNSLFKELGVKNGDIVHNVNGQELTSMASAMSAYESLQNDKNFTFEITRRNQRQTFEYEIR